MQRAFPGRRTRSIAAAIAFVGLWLGVLVLDARAAADSSSTSPSPFASQAPTSAKAERPDFISGGAATTLVLIGLFGIARFPYRSERDLSN